MSSLLRLKGLWRRLITVHGGPWLWAGRQVQVEIWNLGMWHCVRVCVCVYVCVRACVCVCVCACMQGEQELVYINAHILSVWTGPDKANKKKKKIFLDNTWTVYLCVLMKLLPVLKLNQSVYPVFYFIFKNSLQGLMFQVGLVEWIIGKVWAPKAPHIANM